MILHVHFNVKLTKEGVCESTLIQGLKMVSFFFPVYSLNFFIVIENQSSDLGTILNLRNFLNHVNIFLSTLDDPLNLLVTAKSKSLCPDYSTNDIKQTTRP